ncbi:MAG TPA: hypothetical protein VEY33_12420 [Gemmatimonadota bacterium]|nr:hypothetical protein [Gemmatimonadota bacterium]
MSETERDRELEARLARAPRDAEPARDLWLDVARAIDSTPALDTARTIEPRAEIEPAHLEGPRRRIPRVPLQIAAALALFAGGVMVGQRWGEPAPPAPAPESPLAAAAEVQRAGTEYVSALSRLGESAGQVERDQGVDAALSALQGAAYELVRLRPDDPQAGRILYTVSEARADGDGTQPTVRF